MDFREIKQEAYKAANEAKALQGSLEILLAQLAAWEMRAREELDLRRIVNENPVFFGELLGKMAMEAVRASAARPTTD